MKTRKTVIVLAIFFVLALVSTELFAKHVNKKRSGGAEQGAPAEQPAPVAATGRVIAIGDVDAGYNMSGTKAVDVKETIQLGLKKELEKMGYTVNITSPAVVTEDAEMDTAKMPALPTDRAPTQKEMQDYMASMQRWQKQMSGEVRVHKPVAADAYFDIKVGSSEGGSDTRGAMNTIGRVAGLDTSWGDMATDTTKVYLVCSMRDPSNGALEDRYTAKASSVKFRDLGGYTSYDYGDNYETREKLFRSAIKKCANWMAEKVK